MGVTDVVVAAQRLLDDERNAYPAGKGLPKSLDGLSPPARESLLTAAKRAVEAPDTGTAARALYEAMRAKMTTAPRWGVVSGKAQEWWLRRARIARGEAEPRRDDAAGRQDALF